ncbi:MAG: EAL and modified HD-GYP domain-containing signal transduction protein [Polaribacter sp.]|jgi:EAL and modified HD-GYP domain-containing signal transduction protein
MPKKSIDKPDIQPANDLLFARQPIFDSKKELYGFELLYRDNDPNVAIIEDGDKATSGLLVNYCGSIINDDEGPYVKIFINLTKNLLMSDYFFPLEPSRIVVEILEDIKVDQDLINRVIDLKAKGYQFALDDYEFTSEFDQLIPLMDFIKVELLNLSLEELKIKMTDFELSHLSKLKKRPILLAEKVEDQATYDVCHTMGFELFQGYFLERPKPIYGKKIDNHSDTALQIIVKLQESNLSIEDLSHAISRDTKLSYQILKIVNSPLCRLPKKVESLQDAVIYLGLEQIKKWAMAMALSGNSSQSNELFRILLARARACELIAIYHQHERPEAYFTIGLFSGIDAVMLADKQWLINKLDLATDITEALLEFKGEKGRVLCGVIDIEHGDFKFTDKYSDEQRHAYYAAHETAINWANQLFLML